MKYLTLVQKEIPENFKNNIDDTIMSLLNLNLIEQYYVEEQESNISLYSFDDEFSISLLSQKYIEHLQIQEINIEEVIKNLNKYNVNIKSLVDENGNLKRITISEYEKNKHLYTCNKIWDEKLNMWKYIPKEVQSHIFKQEHIFGKNKDIYEKIIHKNRMLRTFHIWKVSDLHQTEFSDACSVRSYSLLNLETLTHSTKKLQELVINEDNKYSRFTSHSKVLDIDPIACITYQEFTHSDIYRFMHALSIHPQCAARTIQELFRLIIEWAYSHTNLGNNEPTAVICHEILRCVQMPENVRNDILSIVPPQVVERYIRGDINAIVEREDDPPMPESFKEWISDIYMLFYNRCSDQYLNIDIDNLPQDYPM